jgi:acylphosphatase
MPHVVALECPGREAADGDHSTPIRKALGELQPGAHLVRRRRPVAALGAGMGRDDVPEHDVVLDSEPGEDAVDDRGRRLRGAGPGELALRRERETGDPGSAIAGRLAHEQDRRVGPRDEVRREAGAAERCPRPLGVLIEGLADTDACQLVDDEIHASTLPCAGTDTRQMELVRRRIVVQGRVQGVWFRESARRRAEQVGVAGWVRNRPDGAVEAELEGSAEDVEVLVAWFRLGPPDARVERVEIEELSPIGERGFATRR